MTYRDAQTYQNVVQRGPLYPLNSLMLHGIIYAKSAHGLNYDTNNILRSEIRAYFGCGTQLQEMYITPGLLTPENWDTLGPPCPSAATAQICVPSFSFFA